MSSTNTQMFYDKTVKRILTQSSRQRSNPNRLVPLVLSSLKGTSKHSHFLLRILLCTFLIFWTSLLFFLLSLFDYISDSSDPSDAFLCLSTDYPPCSLRIEFSIYRYSSRRWTLPSSLWLTDEDSSCLFSRRRPCSSSCSSYIGPDCEPCCSDLGTY